MWNSLKNVVAIRSVDLVQADVRIKNLNFPPLSNQLFEKCYHGALPQVVRAFFERQPEHANALRRQIENRVDGALDEPPAAARIFPGPLGWR